MQTRPRPTLGIAMIAIASLLFAVNGTVSKLILQTGISAPDLTTLRAFGACLGLVAVGAALRPGLPRFRITRGELPLLISYGLAGFFAVPMLYFVAIARLPVGIALLFEYTAPLFVVLWVRFGLRQQVRPRLWAGLGLGLLGLACVVQVWGRLRLDAVGVLAGLAAAVLLASFYLLGARGVASRDTISLAGWAFGVSALAGMILRLVTGHLPDWSTLTGDAGNGAPVWLLVGYLLIGGTIVPYLLNIASLRHLPATSVSILSMAEPVLAATVAWVVMNERLNAFQMAGGLVLLFGVGLAETARLPVRQNETHAAATPERDRSPARA